MFKRRSLQRQGTSVQVRFRWIQTKDSFLKSLRVYESCSFDCESEGWLSSEGGVGGCGCEIIFTLSARMNPDLFGISATDFGLHILIYSLCKFSVSKSSKVRMKNVHYWLWRKDYDSTNAS